MKIPVLISISVAALLTGCGKNSTAGNAANDASTVANAPMNYLKTATAAEKSSENKINVASLTEAINQFNVQEGRYPTNLDELAAKHYIGKVPQSPIGYKIVYNSTDGSIKVVRE